MLYQGGIWLWLLSSLTACVLVKAQVSPPLSVTLLPNDEIELSWPQTAVGFLLEQTDSLQSATVWSPLSAETRIDQGSFRVTLEPVVTSRFFRVRLASNSPAEVSLSTTLLGSTAEEGQPMQVWAIVTGDAQIRTVEFFLDDQIASSVTNFPFAASLLTPLRSATKSNFTLQARLTDTAGKTLLSEKKLFELLADVRPPAILASDPAPGSFQLPIDTVEILFAEPIQPELVTPDSVRLLDLGGSDLTILAADKVVPGVTAELRADRRSLVLHSASKLRPGLYGIQIRPPLADQVGNPVVPFISRFRVFDPADSDGDGVPDQLEPSLGLIVGKIDSDGNGRNDGLEDFDKDGLSNAFEIQHGLDPLRADTDGNGINDGDEDSDKDGLTNAQEALLGTDPLRADTDGDGWTDEVEVSAGSNPLDPNSVPEFLVIVAGPAVELLLPGAPQPQLPQDQEIGLTMANPSPTALVPASPPFDPTGDDVAGVAVANPLVSLVLPAAPQLELSNDGLTLAQPSVELILPQAPQLQPDDDAATTLASPPATLQFKNNNVAVRQFP
jgi:hypothetical protein